jgi:hypothetical protein
MDPHPSREALKKEAARLLATLARKKWGLAQTRQRILGITPTSAPWLGTMAAFATFRGAEGRCDYCGDHDLAGFSEFAIHGPFAATPDGFFCIASDRRRCLIAFFGEAADVHRRYELYLALRAGLGDPGSPLGRLPRDVFGRLWAWCARLFVWEA